LLPEVAVWLQMVAVDDDMSFTKSSECKYFQHSGPLWSEAPILVAAGVTPWLDVQHVIAIGLGRGPGVFEQNVDCLRKRKSASCAGGFAKVLMDEVGDFSA
jgi:hypothetical protein